MSCMIVCDVEVVIRLFVLVIMSVVIESLKFCDRENIRMLVVNIVFVLIVRCVFVWMWLIVLSVMFEIIVLFVIVDIRIV